MWGQVPRSMDRTQTATQLTLNYVCAKNYFKQLSRTFLESLHLGLAYFTTVVVRRWDLTGYLTGHFSG